MSGQAVSIQNRELSHRLLAVLILLALPIVLSACAPFALTADDRAAIDSGKKRLVLVRILCTVDDKPFEPCIFRRTDPFLSDKIFVGFALGSFDTFGEPRSLKIQALSDESFDQGWAAFLVSPGIYYLYVRGPDSSTLSQISAAEYYSRYQRDAPRWQIDVPDRAKLVYAGTLTLGGKQTGTLLFGDKIIVPVENQQADLSDGREAAESLLAGHFPGKEVHNILMKAWKPGDSFIFRRPLPGFVK